MTEPTKLAIKTETAPAPAPATRGLPFEHLRREIDHLFDTFQTGEWRLPFSRLAAPELAWPRKGMLDLVPAVDVSEKPTAYEISAELPGLEEKDVEVKLANGILTLKGEKKEQKEEREKDYYISERRYGSFVRSFRVPDGVDADKIEAQFAKGVLTVTLPKTAEAKNGEKTIAVKAA